MSPRKDFYAKIAKSGTLTSHNTEKCNKSKIQFRAKQLYLKGVSSKIHQSAFIFQGKNTKVYD